MRAGRLRRIRYWRTKSGVIVEERGRKLEHCPASGRVRVKIAGYRVPTGGWHGWLWIHKLHPLSRAAVSWARKLLAVVEVPR